MDEPRKASWWIQAQEGPRDAFYARQHSEMTRLSAMTNSSQFQAVGMAYHRATRKQKEKQEFAT